MTHINLSDAISLANQGEYRAALIAFETVWHHERSESLRSLILLCNALHQLQRGHITAPRRNLDTAIRLLEDNPPPLAGVDLPAALATIRAVRAAIPDELETGTGSVAWEAIPPVVL